MTASASESFPCSLDNAGKSAKMSALTVDLISNMKRHAFKMQLKPGVAAEYQRRHDEIWPELAAELKAAGVSDYSIFFDQETLTLFAVQKLSDGNTAADLPRSPVVRKWWDYMSPLMEVNPDGSPVAKPLGEVFHLD